MDGWQCARDTNKWYFGNFIFNSRTETMLMTTPVMSNPKFRMRTNIHLRWFSSTHACRSFMRVLFAVWSILSLWMPIKSFWWKSTKAKSERDEEKWCTKGCRRLAFYLKINLHFFSISIMDLCVCPKSIKTKSNWREWAIENWLQFDFPIHIIPPITDNRWRKNENAMNEPTYHKWWNDEGSKRTNENVEKKKK